MNRLDIASPVGILRLTASGDKLLRIWFTDLTSVQYREQTAVLKETQRQLTAYFEGELQLFDLPLAPEGTDFQRKVWMALQEIPFGRSWSYRQLAVFLGDPKCIRAAGTANGKNPLPIVIPCHRVIGSDGSLVGFGGGLWRKKWLLRHERHPAFVSEQSTLFG